ncbi:MAG: 6-hydroxymethylpterin diphosphokinase MptE-like protein [Methanomassiliicoccales archaeon]
MDYREWEPLYFQILEEFNFSRSDDEMAAHILNTLVKNKRICEPDCLKEVIQCRATIYGYGPNLERDIEIVKPAGTIISADGATTVLLKNGIVPDVIVTDLDGDVLAQIRANSEGSIAVIHAHGDNIQRICDALPFFEGRITPTTQSKPFDRIYNFGGFTDGDRAVMLARHFGAKRIFLVGFDFELVREQAGKDSEIKARKLRWARRLIFDFNPPYVQLLTP